MSVLVITTVTGDTAKFRQSLTERASDFEQIAKEAQSQGAIHHRFGITATSVVVVDEWESREQFEQFFSNPALQQFISEVGGDSSAMPQFTYAEAISSPDQF